MSIRRSFDRNSTVIAEDIAFVIRSWAQGAQLIGAELKSLVSSKQHVGAAGREKFCYV